MQCGVLDTDDKSISDHFVPHLSVITIIGKSVEFRVYFSAISHSSWFRLLTLAHLRTYARGEARNYVTNWKSVLNGAYNNYEQL